MEQTDQLKARIAELAPRMPFYLLAEYYSHPQAAEGTCSYNLAGNCFEWAHMAATVLEANGLEVLPMCTASERRVGANHAFLLVRDPQTKAVAYYDPTAEQFGVIGAHKRAFTRDEIEAHNTLCQAQWLEKPILFHDWKIKPEWRDHWEEFETMRHVWGEEIHYDIPHIVPGERSSNYGMNTHFFGL